MGRVATARRLPADLFSVTLTIQQRRPWFIDADDDPDWWYVSADALGEDGATLVGHVGDMRFVIVDLEDTQDPFGMLDGDDADLSAIAEAIFDPRTGELVDELDEMLEVFGDRILIMDSVRLEPAWRGFGIGALLAATAIKRLSGGVRAVVCYPAPTDGPGASVTEPDDGDSPQRQVAIEALGRVWSRVGFEHFRDGVWVLDLNLVTFGQCLAKLHAEALRNGRP